MKTILVLVLDGVMDSSLAITLDTLRSGQAFQQNSGKGGKLRVLVAGHRKTVTTGGGMRMTTDLRFPEVVTAMAPAKAMNSASAAARTGGALRPDWIIVPGLGLVSDAAIDTRLAQKDALAAMDLLRRAPEATRIGASCSAVFLLARSGLLDGRQATMTWWLAGLFRARHPAVRLDETRMLVRDGRFLSAGSAFAQLDLALAIVAESMGESVAHLCSRYLLIDQRPSQARYMMQARAQQVDPTVIAAERWIDAHLSEAISVTALASALAVSPKTLARRIDAATGVSPVKFIQRRRLLRASHLIESTTLSIEAIAAEVGYQDGTALRKLVKRAFGVTPAALRG
ncbi:MAG TPA: helix-turn-helix domain-containing protein [Noviherbaspirillum sp.]|jgi:transcriptional regulator GlxA family with amidase domain|uniref:GlxA family transcriptional regulator n=1 Tax=Noviherbaspirillum sp. TaxID=1926288 RepID=UPI002F92F234